MYLHCPVIIAHIFIMLTLGLGGPSCCASGRARFMEVRLALESLYVGGYGYEIWIGLDGGMRI